MIPYVEKNKYSLNVLISALEKEGLGNYIKVVKVNNFLDYLLEIKNKYELMIVAMSLMTTQIPNMLNRIRKLNQIKEKNPRKIITVLGGPHASGDPYGSILSLGFDVVFIGEAEKTFPEFIRSIIGKEDPLAIKGIAYWNGERFKLTGREKPIDLNEYPPFSEFRGLFNPIEITRGCPYACKYCQVSFTFGCTLRHRNLDNIMKYARILLARGIRDLRFISPNSFGYGLTGKSPDPSPIIELVDSLQEIRAGGGRVYLGTFPSEVRPEFVTDDLMRYLKDKVDNKRIVIGAQSGSDRLLKILGRQHSADDVLDAVYNARKYGFMVDVDYIFGLPHELEDDIYETINHMKKVVELGGRIHAHVFMPLPGTPYSLEPPGILKEVVKKELNKLLGKGRVFGYWYMQEKMAKIIDDLRKSGIIIINSERAYRFLDEGVIEAPRKSLSCFLR